MKLTQQVIVWGVLILLPGFSANAATSDFACGTTEVTTALSDTVNARLVFVAFPDDTTRLDLPTWKDSVASELMNFFDVMSRGKHSLTLST